MRINIETTPLNKIEWLNRYMYFHYWKIDLDRGVVIMTIRFTYLANATWSGIGIGLNLWELKHFHRSK